MKEDDGSFSVPVSRTHSSQSISQGSRGIVAPGADGRDRLFFNWLPRRDAFALGYFLSGIALSHRGAQDGNKAEKYLREGVRMTRGKQKFSLSLAPFQH